MWRCKDECYSVGPSQHPLSGPHLLTAGIHPTTISDSIQLATERAVEVLTAMASPLSLSDRESLLKSATTSLSSKVVSAWDVEHVRGLYLMSK